MRMKNKSYKLKQLNGVWNTVGICGVKQTHFMNEENLIYRSRCVPHTHRQNIITT